MKLYHYTTSNVLTSILRSKEIWFTDFRFLNDAQEFYFARNIVDNTLRTYGFEKRIRDFKQAPRLNDLYLSTFNNLVTNFKNRLVPTHFESFQYNYMPYVFSLSATQDSLSQWRAYGKGELCIEFDSDKLTQATGGKLLCVQYKSRGDTDDRLSKAIDKFFDDVLEQFQRSGHLDIETVQDGSKDLGHFFQSQFSPIGVKHTGFRDEHEWRLIKEFSLQDKSRTETFFDGGRYPTPRAKVRFRSDIGNLPEIITGIMFGPGSDKDIARSSIAALNLAMDTQYEAQFSDIPYRS